MKYNVYYGYGTGIEDKEIIGTFDKIKDAEDFVYKHIKKNQKENYYVIKTIVNKFFMWYDYGSYFKFYTIFGYKKTKTT